MFEFSPKVLVFHDVIIVCVCGGGGGGGGGCVAFEEVTIQ